MVHHISHKIGVMYLGNMVELGSSDDVYKKPLHPYTRALISAAPIADPKMAKEKKRIILEGEVPSPINPPKGCPFAGRCKYATEECKSKNRTHICMITDRLPATYIRQKFGTV